MADGLVKGKSQMERRVNARGFRSCKRDKSAHWTGRGRAYMVIEVKPGSPTLYGIGGANASDQIEKWLPEEKLEKWVVESVRAGRDKPVKLDAVIVADDKTAFSGICPKCGRIVSFDFGVVGYCNRCAQCIDTEPEHYLNAKYTTLEEAKSDIRRTEIIKELSGKRGK